MIALGGLITVIGGAVSVPAGTFVGIRVSLTTDLLAPGTAEQASGTDVSWYVPKIRRSEKSVTSGKDGSQGLIQLISCLLK